MILLEQWENGIKSLVAGKPCILKHPPQFVRKERMESPILDKGYTRETDNYDIL